MFSESSINSLFNELTGSILFKLSKIKTVKLVNLHFKCGFLIIHFRSKGHFLDSSTYIFKRSSKNMYSQNLKWVNKLNVCCTTNLISLLLFSYTHTFLIFSALFKDMKEFYFFFPVNKLAFSETHKIYSYINHFHIQRTSSIRLPYNRLFSSSLPFRTSFSAAGSFASSGKYDIRTSWKSYCLRIFKFSPNSWNAFSAVGKR